jgi:ABC-type Zn uptake system ZnuABC Zn-binding protein ZnuA
MSRILSLFVIGVLFGVFSIGLVSSQEDRLQIVASHSILGDVVSQVAGDAADVTTTMPRGADPHSFIPRPSDLVAIANADVVFVNGAGFEEGLLEAIANAGSDVNPVAASACVRILAFGAHDHDQDHDHDAGDDNSESEVTDSATSPLAALCEQHVAEMAAIHGHDHAHEGDDDHTHEGDDDHAHEGDDDHADEGDDDHADEGDDDHADEGDDDHAHEGDDDHALEGDEVHAHEGDGDHAHDHEHAEFLGQLYTLDCESGHGGPEGDDHAHEHGACDPHVWTEPHNAMYWTMLIRDTLVELDPANAETYRENAAEYLLLLDDLAHEFVMPLVDTLPEDQRILITNHDAFGYFANRFGFQTTVTIIPSGTTLAEPSAAELAAVIDLIRETGVPAIFSETTVSDELAQQIAEETGARVYVLYSGTLSEVDGPASTYVEYIRYNVETIVGALSGDA